MKNTSAQPLKTPERMILLGSTGSIGTQTLDVIRQFGDRFEVVGLAAGENLERFATQIHQFKPKAVAIASASRADELRQLAPDYQGAIYTGVEGLDTLLEEVAADTVVVGLVGMLGLCPTLTALKLGKKVVTANKETFVAGGHLIQPYLNQIVPMDSEHSAIFQCLQQAKPAEVKNILLTASGGPFRDHSLQQLQSVTLSQALKHPNWVMGPKVTIDSATLMNKGLEVIEAHWLFGVGYDDIQVVLHPESMIHSGVEFVDGSVMVQMGTPDMRIPIQYALTYPERWPLPFPESRLSLAQLGQLTLLPPDFERFPCLPLAYEAGRLGGTATTVLNAANERVVQRFLQKDIVFLDIPRILERVLSAHQQQGIQPHPDLETIQHWDAWARNQALETSAILTH